jgi:hypothetical protein
MRFDAYMKLKNSSDEELQRQRDKWQRVEKNNFVRFSDGFARIVHGGSIALALGLMISMTPVAAVAIAAGAILAVAGASYAVGTYADKRLDSLEAEIDSRKQAAVLQAPSPASSAPASALAQAPGLAPAFRKSRIPNALRTAAAACGIGHERGSLKRAL